MLKSSVIKISELTENNIESMFNLMSKYYANLKKDNFFSDLEDKEDIIILKDNKGAIKGFSSIVIQDLFINNERVKLLFSGDTVIHSEYWGDTDIRRTWLEYAYKQMDLFDEKFYWLLFSKGYKTYKYLPVFFTDFYPRFDKQTPEFEQKIIDAYGYKYYPDNYNVEKGVIEMNQKKDYLKDWVAEIPEGKLKDKNIEFFMQKNPDYKLGNELICLTRITADNFTKAGMKVYEALSERN